MNETFWGKSALIDLHYCNENIKNPKKIREFFNKLCKKIRMKKSSPLYLKKFGKGDLNGYSAMQFIETSSITAHFDEKKGKSYRAFIDIFSCKNFNEKKAVSFCKEFFGAKNINSKTLIRK